MKYLIFAELNKNHFLFLTYFIISAIQEIDNRYITKTDDIIEIFHIFYIYTLSDFLSIIPLIIIKIRSKRESQNFENLDKNLIQSNSIENKKYKLLYNDTLDNKKRKKRKIILSVILSFFDFFALYLNVIFKIITQSSNYQVKQEKLNSMILFNIISKYILSVLILHLSVYKHHYLSLAINLLFLILLIIYDFLHLDDKKAYFYVLMKIIVAICYAFEDTYAKILLSIDSVSPYNLLIYRGIFENILAFLFSFVFIFVEIPDENGIKSCVFSRFWKIYKNKLNILLYIILFFVHYLQNINIFAIIDKFSPIHFAVATIFENIGSLIISIIYGEIFLDEFFIKLAIYFILILSILVFNEFIVLNFCGFQKYTKIFLEQKANKDIEQTIINNKENNNESESEDNVSTKMINIRNFNYQINELDLIDGKDTNSNL